MKTVYVRFRYGSCDEDERIVIGEDIDTSDEWLKHERDKRAADWLFLIPEEMFGT